MISHFPHEFGPPSEDCLHSVLGPSLPLWKALVADLEAASKSPGTWKSYGPKYGWRLDFRRGSSPLAGIYPGENRILLGINLLQREWSSAFALPLGVCFKQILEASQPLRDGRFLLLPVTDSCALSDAAMLINLKSYAPSKS